MADIIADAIGHRLRAEDTAECEALGLTGPVAVRESIKASVLSYGAFGNGECMAAWGFTRSSAIWTANSMTGITAYPWLLTTDAVERHKRTFLKANREFIEFVNGEYPILETWVHAEYSKALRWLRHLGFLIEQPAPFGPLQKSFCHVVRRVVC